MSKRPHKVCKRFVVCWVFWLRKRTDFKSFKLWISCSDIPEERMLPLEMSPIDTYFPMRAILLSPLSSRSFHFERRENNFSLLMHNELEPSTSSKRASLTTGLSLSASSAFTKIISLAVWRRSSIWKSWAIRKIRQAHVGSSCSWRPGSYCCFYHQHLRKIALEENNISLHKAPHILSHSFICTHNLITEGFGLDMSHMSHVPFLTVKSP